MNPTSDAGIRLRTLHRRFRPSRGGIGESVPATIMLDAALLISAFILAIQPFVLQPGIRLELPGAPLTDGIPFNARILIVSQDDWVYFNDERVAVEALGRVLAEAARSDPSRPLLIQADRRIRHGTLTAIYNHATAAGFEEVIMGTRASLLYQERF